jgi:hypothetical protein
LIDEEIEALIAHVNANYQVALSPQNYDHMYAREVRPAVYFVEVSFPTGTQVDDADVNKKLECSLTGKKWACEESEGFRSISFNDSIRPIEIVFDIPGKEAREVLEFIRHTVNSVDGNADLSAEAKAEIRQTDPKTFYSISPTADGGYEIQEVRGICGGGRWIYIKRVQCGEAPCPLKWDHREIIMSD